MPTTLYLAMAIRNKLIGRFVQVRSAQSLLTITHELKRALLLYDFQAIGEGYRERTKVCLRARCL